MMKSTLVTGAAGFIGFHVARALLGRGVRVVGLDNLNPYYDVSLKKARLAQLIGEPNFAFHHIELAAREAVAELFRTGQFTTVIHLAAQAGVRHSLHQPHAYLESNLAGFLNILEGCRHHAVQHLVYASSSSVYGANTNTPFSVHHHVDHPVSLYAATKKANELMAHSYSHLFALPTTGLRFFTVYGPWGRPDMAYFKFTKAILAEEPIELYNHGKMRRDFTYIDDIVEGVIRTADRPPQADPEWCGAAPDPGTSSAPYRIFNIGNNQPVALAHFVAVLEKCLGKTAQKKYLPMQPGDVMDTCADVDALMRHVGFRPATTIEAGLDLFVHWYREYYRD